MITKSLGIKNDTLGSWEEEQIIEDNVYAGYIPALYLADMDNDGDNDIITARSSSSEEIAWQEK